MEAGGAIPNLLGKQVPIGPQDLLEVELEPGVAIGLSLVDEVGAQDGAMIRVGQNGMTHVRINIFIDDQRNDGNLVRMGGVDDVPPRITCDAAVGVRVIPGGAEHVDLAQVRKQRGAAVVRVDVVHLDHATGHHLGQRRGDREAGALKLTAARSVRGIDAGVDHHHGMVGQTEARRDDVDRLCVAPGKGRLPRNRQVRLRLRPVGDRPGEADGCRHADRSVGLQTIEVHRYRGAERWHHLERDANLHCAGGQLHRVAAAQRQGTWNLHAQLRAARARREGDRMAVYRQVPITGVQGTADPDGQLRPR